VKEPDGTGDEQPVAARDRTIEPRLSRPRAFDLSRVVAKNDAEDAQPPSSGNHALRHDGTDYRRVVAGSQRRNRVHGRRVLVAMRQVIQEVPAGLDVHLREALGPARPDALQVLYGS
jgi:hypothetical protein